MLADVELPNEKTVMVVVWIVGCLFIGLFGLLGGKRLAREIHESKSRFWNPHNASEPALRLYIRALGVTGPVFVILGLIFAYHVLGD